jgi:RNA methyltransferase, TrmH family
MITSKSNPKIVQIRSLLGQRKARVESGEFVIEGVRLCEEAYAANIKPRVVLFTEGLSNRGRELITNFENGGSDVEEVPELLMRSLSETETSQGILAVVPFHRMPAPEKKTFVVIADAIRDPGNLGTLMRSAAAAGVEEFIVTPGSVDPFSPKVVRSGMGAHFRLAIREAGWNELSNSITGSVLLADMDGGSLWDTDLTQPVTLIIGGEAEGASEEAYHLATGRISIPMPGQSESLNAAVAGSILIFEVLRQRRQ